MTGQAVAAIADTSKLCLHTVTTRPLALEAAIPAYQSRGVAGITIWPDVLEGLSIPSVRRQLADAGIEVVSLCRGGFFASTSKRERVQAIDATRRLIALATEVSAPLIVLVCGADPAQPLDTSRGQIAEAISQLLPEADAAGVKLGVEPLHPMYADTRSAINTVRQANDLCATLESPQVGVVVDVYHVWWEPDLDREIARCGAMDRLFAFHVCDWRVPTREMLNDRAIMGEGCIPIRQIRGWVEAAGFDGFHEVEIFSNDYWEGDQEAVLDRIVSAYLHHT